MYVYIEFLIIMKKMQYANRIFVPSCVFYEWTLIRDMIVKRPFLRQSLCASIPPIVKSFIDLFSDFIFCSFIYLT